MKSKQLAFFALFFSLFLTSFSAAADPLAEDLLGNLQTMKTVYRATYAPTEWKKKFAGYDLGAEFDKAVAAVQRNPELTTREGWAILKDFVYAMKDYHVSVSFLSTEAASLPFQVKGAGDRYFLAYVDRAKLPVSAFPFQIGDELITFGDRTAAQAVAEVQAEYIENVPATDRARAEQGLTKRSAARGMTVPRGPIVLGFKARGSEKVSQIQLLWDYVPEKIAPRGTLGMVPERDSFFHGATERSSLFRPVMSADVAEGPSGANPHEIGARRAFTPILGTPVWESADDNVFHAYLYKTADRKLVGYVRVASYSLPDYNKASADFAKIIGLFEATADSMVIDQVNNPGGSVFYLYNLASMLSDKPLRTPRHRMAVTQADVADALKYIAMLEGVKTDEDAKKALAQAGEDPNGYPATYQFAQFSLSYARFIVDEWAAGRKLTRPYWIAGVDQINPAPVRFTKPILLLTNHLDFSGGDFFPAILQDNHRVTILGARTAGAGGYVNNAKIFNNVGINEFRVTQSLAERVDGNPIENLGVKPDIEYEMTVEDLTQHYAPYVRAIHAAIASIAP